MIQDPNEFKLESGFYKNTVNSTICIAMPRSGSTLLMRLMNLVGHTPVMGDRPKEFFEGVIQMYNASFEKASFTRLQDAEKHGSFTDMYRAKDQDDFTANISWHLLNILFGGTGTCFMKSTILGFGNDLVEPFVELIRKINDSPRTMNPVNIAWLRRDPLTCAKSLESRFNPDGDKERFIENAMKFYERQVQQFKSCGELGDIFIDYDDLVSNTQKVMIKCGPRYFPKNADINKIMERKIR